MVSTLGLALGGVLTLLVVALHYSRGSEWRNRADITDEVIETRAASVPQTDIPEPGNRAIGSGGAGVAAVGDETADGELEAEGEPAEAEGPWSLPDEEAETFEIEYAKEGSTIEVKENETLLEAGEDEGWDLPYSCRQGQCVSCGGHVADGPSEDYLVHDDQEMLDENELDEGYTLTCVAYPQSDMTLETGETP